MATGSVGFGRVLHLALLGLLCHLARASVRPEAGRAVQVPVVLWHGMGESCYNGRMKSLEEQLQSHLGEGSYIKVLCFGESAREDSANSFFFEANKQVQAACDAIASDAALRDGYHAVGVSQGGQFMRAVAQRCPSPPMKVLVTLGSQHQGVYGLPRCRPAFLCNLARRAASLGAYWGWVQKRLVQAQYWHDPRNPTAYRRRSTFIANINNDVEDASKRNASYATNLAALEKLVLVRFNQDKMVVPLDSQWFEFYADGSTKTIVPLKESRIYQEDWIGLKALDEGGRLVRLEIDGDHLRFPFSWFASEVVDKYMRTPPTNVAA